MAKETLKCMEVWGQSEKDESLVVLKLYVGQ